MFSHNLIYLEALHWPSNKMICSRPLIGQYPPPLPQLWTQLVDLTRGPNSWTQLVDRTRWPKLWTQLVNPTCRALNINSCSGLDRLMDPSILFSFLTQCYHLPTLRESVLRICGIFFGTNNPLQWRQILQMCM